MTEANPVRPTTDSVDEFIAANDSDGSLSRIDAVITAALPVATPRQLWRGVFWGGTDQSIIGYGVIVQDRPRGPGVEWFLVGLARQKAYLSLYVNAAEGRTYLSRRYGPKLGKVKVGAAALSFKSADDLDLDVLDELVRHAARC